MDWIRKVRICLNCSYNRLIFVRASTMERDGLNNKLLVELEDFAELGLKSGVLNMGSENDKEPNFVILENCAHRICAPRQDDDRFYSLIFWTKDSPDDNLPMPAKIVCPLSCP